MTKSSIAAMDFCTLGMFIIDDIYYPPPKAPVFDVVGGAGAYAALGARLFRPVPHNAIHETPGNPQSTPQGPQQVGWIVHQGSDFPMHIHTEIVSWQTSCEFIPTPNRLTTRGLNLYRHNGRRDFEYRTPKIRVDHSVLPIADIMARSFHLICSPNRCISLLENIRQARSERVRTDHFHAPYVVWEPVPDLCLPSELGNVHRALEYVNVISPNLHELSSLFGATENELAADIQKLRECCEALLASMTPTSAVVVRMGSQGCCVATRQNYSTIPAYYGAISSLHKVVDPTGAGNAFLGAFAIRLVDDIQQVGTLNSWEMAAIWGSVAASFAVEQVGMPKVTHDPCGEELWNGERVWGRLKEYEGRCLRLDTSKDG